MFYRLAGCVLLFASTACVLAAPVAPPAPATRPAAPVEPIAESRIVAVTVYQGTALVTREVTVTGGKGLIEMIVSPLPEQTLDQSLYTEGTDALRVLSTRYRTRAVQQDTREDIRAAEKRILDLMRANESLQQEIASMQRNVEFLGKLETFTSATTAQLTEKGMLNGETVIVLSKFVMDSRNKLAADQVTAKQTMQDNEQMMQFVRRQMSEATAGASKTLRDAVIVIDKADAAAGKVRLNYLVSAASWRPKYKLRANAAKDPVQLESLAAIVQQSGEDWTGVNLTLSTAQPMLSAAPPELLALDIDVAPRVIAQPGADSGKGGALQRQVQQEMAYRENFRRARDLKEQAQKLANSNNDEAASVGNNTAAAIVQQMELLEADDDVAKGVAREFREGPSVTVHVKNVLTIPSRNDEQLIEMARLELAPQFFYKAVPVLTPHVYRIAMFENTSNQVLLPGEATMYIGSDFVGRANLPLVAIGERFTAGFGVDPQLQVERQLLDKNKTVQGGNQVHAFAYRIRISSFKTEAVTVQVWDRLPHAEVETVGISLVSASPELSADAAYVRAERPQNLLRWDVKVEPGMNGEKSAQVDYKFKLEYDRNLAITNFKATK